MSTSQVVRVAGSQEAEAVRTCVVCAFEHYIERIGMPPAPMLLDFQAEIASNRVWVVEDQGRILGALVQYETPLGFYVDTVAVVPERQGTGLGRALLQFAEHEASRRGYDSLYLCTNSKMTENQSLYPRAGYVEYERKKEKGYDRVFYRKRLGTGAARNAV